MTRFTPYADDAASFPIEALTIENGTDRVTLYGSLELTRDKAGLARARQLREVLENVVRALEAEHALPDAVAGPRAAQHVKNPFG